jgi:hypothetical protein
MVRAPFRSYVSSASLRLSMLALSASGCAVASGEITGGATIVDGAVPQATSVDSGPTETTEGGPLDAQPPSTWTDLYGAYFGPNGAGNCAGSGTCHGDMSQLGYMASSFLCPTNDPTGCYSGVTSSAAGLLLPAGPFDKMYLYMVLRKAVGTNVNLPMPKSPIYTFSPDDIAKISSWVAAGALDN